MKGITQCLQLTIKSHQISMEPNMEPDVQPNMDPETFDYLWYLMETSFTRPTVETLPQPPPQLPSRPEPLDIPEFVSITEATKDQNRNSYGLLFKQVKRSAALPGSLRIIEKLCEKFGYMSDQKLVEPDEVVNLDEAIKGQLVNYEQVPAFFKNDRGTQHENVVRYIFGRFFVWFGRKRYAMQVMNSKKIHEKNKVVYLRIMSMFVQQVKEMLDTIDQKWTELQTTSVQERAVKYF